MVSLGGFPINKHPGMGIQVFGRVTDGVSRVGNRWQFISDRSVLLPDEYDA
jgi:hypothetical protein